MAVGLPLKTTYANGDVYSASDVNDTNGTVNLFTSSTLSVAAGKNAVINGGFDIAQRGTSGTFTTTAKSFSLDRWYMAAVTGTSMTYSQQASTVTGTRYAGRFGRTSGNTGTSSINIAQDVETSNSIIYAGQAVTVSFYARAGANFSSASNALTHYTIQGTGTDQSDYGAAMTGRTVLTTGTATLTTSFQRFTYTATVASTTTELNFFIGYTPTGTAGANDWFEITGVQLELGSVATTFSRAGGTIQGELAACQRYYYRTSASGANYIFGLAQCYGTTTGGAVIPLPVPMRISPTALEQSGTANQYQAYSSSGAALALTSVPTFASVVTSQFQAAVNFTVGSGLIGGNVTQFTAANSSAFLGWSAEL
jgi:hypothetical protein